jgi:hypothetical protein
MLCEQGLAQVAWMNDLNPCASFPDSPRSFDRPVKSGVNPECYAKTARVNLGLGSATERLRKLACFLG